MRSPLKLIAALSLAGAVSACGKFNMNEMFVSKGQEDSIDSLVQRAQYEFDKGRYDSALTLTDQALAINPNSELPAILKGYVYLSKAGLDGINISKELVNSKTPKEGAPAKTGDTTTDNFNTFKAVLNLTETEFETMGTKASIGTPEQVIYYPKSAKLAREGGGDTLHYLNESIAVFCPLIEANANPETDVDAAIDYRHDCKKNTFASINKGRSNFGWALAHLGEAITFYSIILYDTDGDGVPNIQAGIPKEAITASNVSSFLASINTLNTAVNAIFPTEPAAASASMLNGLFFDLETTASALAAIPGIPSDVSDKVKKIIADLQTKIAKISKVTSAESAQNEALKSSLTTTMAKTLVTKFDTPQFQALPTEDKSNACCVYRNMNPTAAAPTSCVAETYTDAACAAVLK